MDEEQHDAHVELAHDCGAIGFDAPVNQKLEAFTREIASDEVRAALRAESDETKALAELIRKQQRELLATGQLMMLPTNKLTRH